MFCCRKLENTDKQKIESPIIPFSITFSFTYKILSYVILYFYIFICIFTYIYICCIKFTIYSVSYPTLFHLTTYNENLEKLLKGRHQRWIMVTSQQALGPALCALITSIPYKLLPRSTESLLRKSHGICTIYDSIHFFCGWSLYSLFLHISSRKAAPFVTVSIPLPRATIQIINNNSKHVYSPYCVQGTVWSALFICWIHINSISPCTARIRGRRYCYSHL